MTPAHWQSLAETLAGHLLNSVVEGVAIALLGSLIVRTLGKQNSSTRFAVLFSALATVVALPILESLRSSVSPPRATAHSALNLPASWAAIIVMVWAMIAAAGLARIALGFHQLKKLRQTCVPMGIEFMDAALLTTLQRFGAGRDVTLCTSNAVLVPTAIGFSNPAIVIPSWALLDLTPSELNAIVLHELAHLRRRDDLTNLAQKIIRAVLFFHPAVWWLGLGLAREREMACDDFVLFATSDRRAYAECLVSVAEKTFLRRSLALAQAFVGRVQLTAQRVARILAADRQVSSASGIAVLKPAVALIAAASTICLIAFPHVPALVAFDPAQSSLSSPQTGLNPLIASSKYVTSNLAAARSLGAKAIPASFRPMPLHKQGSGQRTSRPQTNPQRAIRSGNPINPTEAYALAPQGVTPVRAGEHSAHAIAAAFRAASNQPSAVFVVMQSSRVDEYGQIWSVCVWHLTVFHSDDRPVNPIFNPAINPEVDLEIRKAVPPKST